MAGASFIGNTATGNGGGIDEGSNDSTQYRGDTISGNHAGGDGGGIVSSPGGTTTSFRWLTARFRGIVPGPRGGGIYDDGTEATVTLTKSSLARNKPDNCEPSGSITGCTR
jgi:hypothetical protein